MKKTIILFVLLINSFPAFAQTTLLRGKVTLQNSNGQPVQGVQISVFGANPTISDTFGQFELEIIGKEPGDLVTLTVQKSVMEVVNRDELEHFVLRKDPDDLLVIVLCPEGKRDKNAALYYGIVLKVHNDQINEIKEEIKTKSLNYNKNGTTTSN